MGDRDATARLTGVQAELERTRLRLERERTARRESDRIAEESLSRLAAADEARIGFLATISHELRTPLTSIAGFTSLLLRDRGKLGEEVVADLLGRIDRNAASLRNMIDDLLDFSRLERDEQTLAPIVGELGPVVRSVLDDQAPYLVDHVVESALAPDVHAAYDPEAVRRMLVNLLVNAARYSPSGTAITVRVAADDVHALVSVADRGPGIPVAERARIFEPFYRGTAAHVLATKGTGIGLSVVKRLAEQLAGSVEVDAVEPTGARFTIRLPLVPPT